MGHLTDIGPLFYSNRVVLDFSFCKNFMAVDGPGKNAGLCKFENIIGGCLFFDLNSIGFAQKSFQSKDQEFRKYHCVFR